MNSLQRIMVGMDFTGMDKAIIRYASFFCRQVQPAKVYFIHIQRNLDVPEGFREKFPELNKPVDERCKEEMMEEVQKNFQDCSRYDIEYIVAEGSPIEQMLHWSHIKNIDLLVAGRKRESEGSGILIERMARKGTCSVLLVPPDAKAQMKRLFMPVDFSENSKMAMKEAMNLAEKDETIRITAYHSYNLPIGYYKTGKTEEEFAAVMLEHSKRYFNEMLDSMKISASRVACVFELETKFSVAEMINRSAHFQQADMIIIGAKGRTNATVILLGSVAEKLMRRNSDIPLLIVKQKDKSFNFLDFIKNV